jgi:hypothetical protein
MSISPARPRGEFDAAAPAARAVQSEALKKLSVTEGLVLVARPPEEFDRYFRGEEERWHKAILDAGIKVE